MPWHSRLSRALSGSENRGDAPVGHASEAPPARTGPAHVSLTDALERCLLLCKRLGRNFGAQP
jgi:hypothetical protein